MTTDQQPAAAVDRIWRDEGARLLARLARRLGDLDVAEEVLQDALGEALEHWPAGLPPNPAGWLATAAWRKAVDRLRRAKAGDAKLALLARTPPGASERDDRLELIFACCHPSLPRDWQVALTLRSVCGLTTAEVAAGFLVPTATAAQRLVRAKRRLRDEGVRFRVPDPDKLADRLQAVLAVVYLVFNEGYLASGQPSAARPDLAAEALTLGRQLVTLMPGEPEVAGLVALMELHQARAVTRFDEQGRLVLLADQDRLDWDREQVRRAVGRLDRALALRRIGPYQVQAAIAALHAQALRYAQTDWGQIRALYGALHRLQPSPLVLLNRAVATRHVHGADVALREVEGVAPALQGYRLLHAVRAELLEELGRDEEAAAATRRALQLAANPAECELLSRRLAALHAGLSSP